MWDFISTSVWRCRTRFSDVLDGRGMYEWHAWKGWWVLYRVTRIHVQTDIRRMCIYICIGWRTINLSWTWGSNGWYGPEMNNSRGASKRAWPRGGPPDNVRGTPLLREWDVGPCNLYTAITRYVVIFLSSCQNVLARFRGIRLPLRFWVPIVMKQVGIDSDRNYSVFLRNAIEIWNNLIIPIGIYFNLFHDKSPDSWRDGIGD